MRASSWSCQAREGTIEWRLPRVLEVKLRGWECDDTPIDLGTSLMSYYQISGLKVETELPLPGAIPLPSAPEEVDVHLSLRAVPDGIESPIAQGPGWAVNAHQFLLDLPDGGRILAANGDTLHLEVPPGGDCEDSMPFLMGTGFGALLYQRGGMILHAATVEHDGNCISICAQSGLGKSTLAAALCRMGCRVVCDDVSAVTLDPNDARQTPLVQPDGRCLKLFDETIARLDLASRRQQPVRSNIGKFYVEPPAALCSPCPLAAIYVLQDEKPHHPAGIERQKVLQTAQILLDQSYRRRLALVMLRQSGRMSAVNEVVLRRVPVFQLTRPRDLDRLEEAAAAVFEHWRGLGR